MEDCELLSIGIDKPLIRHRLGSGNECYGNEEYNSSSNFFEERVQTDFGSIVVARQGAEFRPNSAQHCILTFHDLGLNYQSNFLSFFGYPSMKAVLQRIPIFHINAPGQEKFAQNLHAEYTYPTMEQLAKTLVYQVCEHYQMNHTICLGVGIGANVFARFAACHPKLVDGLFLVNIVPTPAGWLEWCYQKRNVYYLSQIEPNLTSRSEFPQCIVSYLNWHHFGTSAEERSTDLTSMFKCYFSSCEINPKNLALLIDSYIQRDDIGVNRDNGRKISCSSLIITGNDSPHLESSVDMNTRLEPELSTWMKLFDCAMVLDEQAAKVAQAFILFIQGLGLGLLSCVREF